MIVLLKFLILIIFVLLSVAFFTLFERKILGYVHNRLGPNKVFYLGVLQSFSDALKLFAKEDVKFKELSGFFFFFSPFFYLVLVFIFWGLFPFWGVFLYMSHSLIIFICLIGMGVYFLLFSGWCSGSKFSMLGSFRSSSQSISYEVVMLFSLLFYIYIWFALNLLDVFFFNYSFMVFLLGGFSFISWVISCLAECNRSPFDFSEGESELVSGFNVEYGGGLFSFIFLGEYGSIIFLSYITSVFFAHLFLSFLFFLFFSFFYLWVRGTYPRLRYDYLMMLSWKGLLFLVLSIFFFYFYLY